MVNPHDEYKDISKLYMMHLAQSVEEALWGYFPSAKYTNVRHYIERWHEGYNDYCENFHIFFKDDDGEKIDLCETLAQMPNDIIIKIAIELGLDTPGLIPSIPKFKNVLKENNQNAQGNFENAIKCIYDQPDQAVSLASSTLEGIIKTIIADKKIGLMVGDPHNSSLTKLTKDVVNALGLATDSNAPKELVKLAGQLRAIGNTIDDLRSDKSSAHGKTQEEYVIDDPLWAEFIVNSSATLGLFLWSYYERKYLPLREELDTNPDDDDYSDMF